MTIQSPRIPFHELTLIRVPPAAGVYALWQGESVVYYGAADDDFRDCLRQHFADEAFRGVTHFQIEEAGDVMTPRERVAELLLEYVYVSGRYPPFNLPDQLIARATASTHAPPLVEVLPAGNPPVARMQPSVYVVSRR